MVRLTYTRSEWLAIAHELAGSHHASGPPGLAERINALLAQAPVDWPDQPYALELDATCADAVHAVHASLAGRDSADGERDAALAEAEAIVRDHQHPG